MSTFSSLKRAHDGQECECDLCREPKALRSSPSDFEGLPPSVADYIRWLQTDDDQFLPPDVAAHERWLRARRADRDLRAASAEVAPVELHPLERQGTPAGRISYRQILRRQVAEVAPPQVYVGVYTSATHGLLYTITTDGKVLPVPRCVRASRLSKDQFEKGTFFLMGSEHTPEGIVADEFGISIPFCRSFACRAPAGSHCSTQTHKVDRQGVMFPVGRSANIHATYSLGWGSIILDSRAEALKLLCPEKNRELFDWPVEEDDPFADWPPEGGPPSGQEDPPAGQAGHPGSADPSVLTRQ